MLEKFSYLTAKGLFAFGVLVATGSAGQAAGACGRWSQTIRSGSDFLKTEAGSLALRTSSGYLVLPKQGCVALSYSRNVLRFVVNHSADATMPAYLAAHVALVSFSGSGAQTYLYRNHKGGQAHWTNDRSGQPYSSVHDIEHSEFNRDLDGAQASFDGKYRAGTRTWMDQIGQGATTNSTWQSRGTFKVDPRFAGNAGKAQIQTQNYLLSYTTRSADDKSDNELDFTASANGASCVFLRTSGSPNVTTYIAGTYILAFEPEKCAAFIDGFSDKGNFWKFVFGN